MLNDALVGALAALFCLLAATAYTEVKHDEAEASCASENYTLNRQASRCEICVATTCHTGAMSVSNCGKGAACAIEARCQSGTKSKRTESPLRAGLPMQP
ncbi:hypothetical protein [Mesorhizobium wenxiniae]|uniref:hypothetical protein n=1 Tax=Mesorhizobium wenxiniae TaxID=2014805 RepID=UPI001FD9524F|nr:hypothetical protein [Mesorhizobium wenxiniae]